MKYVQSEGRPVYRSSDKYYLFHAEVFWWVGTAIDVSKGCSIRSRSLALTPDQVQQNWMECTKENRWMLTEWAARKEHPNQPTSITPCITRASGTMLEETKCDRLRQMAS